MNAPINLVAEVLKKHKIEQAVIREILEDINHEIASDPDDEKAPAVKKQFVILLSDPSAQLVGKDLVGWVVQLPENASPHSTMERVYKGAYDFNATKKGRLLPVKTVGEALESASAKYFKEAELWVKTKLPVAVIATNNFLPKDEFKTEKVDHRRNE